MKIKKSLPIFLAIAIISGVTFKLAKAWTEPVTAPPSSNVGAPITTGSMDQSKSGRLYVGSILSDYVPAGGNWNYTMRLDSADTTSIGFHDSMTSVGSIRFKANNFTIGANDGWGVANTTFGGSISNYATPQYAQGMSTYVLNSNYWYPSNNSGDTMYVGINNPVIARGDLRAPIFYDYNNTNYYIDPNNGSQFNAVYANNWFRPQGDTGLYFENHGGGLNMIDNTWVRTYGVGNFYAYGESQATTVRANSNLCIGGDCRSAWPTASASIGVGSNVPGSTSCAGYDIYPSGVTIHNNKIQVYYENAGCFNSGSCGSWSEAWWDGSSFNGCTLH